MKFLICLISFLGSFSTFAGVHRKQLVFEYPGELESFFIATQAHTADYLELSLTDFQEQYAVLFQEIAEAINANGELSEILPEQYREIKSFEKKPLKRYTLNNMSNTINAYLIHIIELFECLKKEYTYINSLQRTPNFFDQLKIFVRSSKKLKDFTASQRNLTSYLPIFSEGKLKLFVLSTTQSGSEEDISNPEIGDLFLDSLQFSKADHKSYKRMIMIKVVDSFIDLNRLFSSNK